MRCAEGYFSTTGCNESGQKVLSMLLCKRSLDPRLGLLLGAEVKTGSSLWGGKSVSLCSRLIFCLSSLLDKLKMANGR